MDESIKSLNFPNDKEEQYGFKKHRSNENVLYWNAIWNEKRPMYCYFFDLAWAPDSTGYDLFMY